MVACKELLERYEVAERLAHLLSVDGYHIVVHPVVHHFVSLRCHSLCYLAFVVREYQVHASSVYVEVFAEIFPSHSRTLAVPSWKSVAPFRMPAHDVFGLCFLPQCEVSLVSFLANTVELSRCILNVVEVSSRQYSVSVLLVVGVSVEVDRAV